MNYILPFLYIILFIWLFSKIAFFKTSGLSIKALTVFFLLKIAAGTILTLIYTYYYKDRSTADIFKYFDDAKIIFRSFEQNPVHYLRLILGINSEALELDKYLEETKNWYEHTQLWLQDTGTKNYNFFNSNRLVTRFNAVVLWFSFGNFYVHVVFMCFLSVTGLTAFFKVFKPFFPNKEQILSYALFLLPSTLLWSSGVLKEGLLIFFLGMFLYRFFQLFKYPPSITNIFILILLLYFILINKYYVLAALIPGIIAHSWIELTSGKKPLMNYSLTYIILLVINWGVTIFNPKYGLLEVVSNKRFEAINSAKLAKAKSILFYDTIPPDLVSFIKKAPEAIANVMFKPYLTEANSILVLSAAIENIAICLLILICVVYSKKQFKPHPLAYFFLSYIVLMILIIGYTTPVAGGLIRYKILFIPFLLVLLLTILDYDRLNKMVFWSKKIM